MAVQSPLPQWLVERLAQVVDLNQNDRPIRYGASVGAALTTAEPPEKPTSKRVKFPESAFRPVILPLR